jgi:hypothetical protein
MKTKFLRSKFVFPLPVVFFVGTLLWFPNLIAFEDSKVLPKGVRRFSLRVIGTTVTEKTTNSGKFKTLGEPLQKDLSFKDIVKAEKDPVKRSLAKGFLSNEKFSDKETVGKFAADVQSQTTVYAPIVAYGLSESVTLALVMPIYSMQVAIDSDFRSNGTGQRFIDRLRSSDNNQITSSVDAATKINDAVGRLNNKLADNNFNRLENWSATGLGDLQLAAKWQFLKGEALSSSLMGGVVMPTGRRDDPNNLLDKGFGDGQWDLIAQNTWDQPLSNSGVTISESAKYTHQLPSAKTVRLSSEAETIEVGSTQARFKLGDKVEGTANAQYSNDLGIVGGAGYVFSTKNSDTYRNVPEETKRYLERDTFEQQHLIEMEIGYSGVPAYKRGELPAPFETRLNYKRQLSSRNAPVAHLLQVDMSIFF